MKHWLVTAFAIASLWPMAGQLAAEPIEPGKERQIADLLPPEPGARICFATDYDDAHLSAHPSQSVRSIGFRIGYFAHDPDEFYPRGQRNYYFALSSLLRNGVSRSAPAASAFRRRTTRTYLAAWTATVAEC